MFQRDVEELGVIWTIMVSRHLVQYSMSFPLPSKTTSSSSILELGIKLRASFNYFFAFGGGGTLGCAQCLFLTLCSGITSGIIWGSISDTRDWAQLIYVQGIYLIYCTISLAPTSICSCDPIWFISFLWKLGFCPNYCSLLCLTYFMRLLWGQKKDEKKRWKTEVKFGTILQNTVSLFQDLIYLIIKL